MARKRRDLLEEASKEAKRKADRAGRKGNKMMDTKDAEKTLKRTRKQNHLLSRSPAMAQKRKRLEEAERIGGKSPGTYIEKQKKKIPTTTADRSLKELPEKKPSYTGQKGPLPRKGRDVRPGYEEIVKGKTESTKKKKPNVETAAKGAETFEKIRKGNKTIGKSTPAPGMTKGKSTPIKSKKKAAPKGMPKRSAPKTTSPMKKARRSGKMINSDIRRLKSMVDAYTSTASRNTRPGVISGSQMRRRQEMGKLLSSLKKDLSAAQYKQLNDRIARAAAAGYKRGLSRKM